MKYLPILATVTKVSGQTEHQHQKIDKPGEVQFVDQVYYPIQLLDQMQEDGVDITGWKQAVLMEGKPANRALTKSSQWSHEDEDRQILVPYSYHASSAKYHAEIDAAMSAMNRDLGCINIVKVPHSELGSNKHTHGIMFAWETLTGGGCWSALGNAPGYTGGLGDIEDLGAKPEWQIISLAASCGGLTKSTIQHEVMHALGFFHEHQRPDRDQFINVHNDKINSGWEGQFTKLSTSFWEDSGYPFELGSTMMYCSFCAGNPAMTTKDGTTWGNHGAMTTTDALQIQWQYCKNRDKFQFKETMQCPSPDSTGQVLGVFTDRICDNVNDCHGEEDEGELVECKISGESTQNGCCSTIILDGDECVYKQQFGGRDGYNCASAPDHVVKYVSWFNGGSWVHDTMKWNTNSIKYYDSAKGDIQCPSDADWAGKISCKVNGPKEPISTEQPVTEPPVTEPPVTQPPVTTVTCTAEQVQANIDVELDALFADTIWYTKSVGNPFWTNKAAVNRGRRWKQFFTNIFGFAHHSFNGNYGCVNHDIFPLTILNSDCSVGFEDIVSIRIKILAYWRFAYADCATLGSKRMIRYEAKCNNFKRQSDHLTSGFHLSTL